MTARIVGVVLVRNEDLFVEQAIRNAAGFCDRIHAFDHVSTDRTLNILRSLESEFDHLDVHRIRNVAESHRFIERYAGTETWILGVDGDELYDVSRLPAFREDLLGGAYDRAFRVASNVLNCVELALERLEASGYLSPPARSITKLYNFAAIESWANDGSERLHGGDVVFRRGWDEKSIDNIGERTPWDESPLRCLHLCFIRRSSHDPDEALARPILDETGMHDRSWRGSLKRLVRRRAPPDNSAWKREKYMRGELVTIDASPFFPLRPA